ncbi:MAG: 3',5'-cyclic-nucleotide phosphodiesterase [Burkholderiaceae bacterium]|nr:3',5'-cyclic-nucleotide phosphodiesterase [Burkholderiaceae bacterium]
MKVRVLGCSGAIARDCRTTSFLLDGDLLVDAGTGVGDLSLDEMEGVNDVLLTHSHLDHVAALPLMADAIASRRGAPIRIHALAGTIEALKTHIFNNVIWPDFSRIPSADAPFVSFHEIRVGQLLSIGGKRIEVLPAVHTVPAVAYAITGGARYWVFTGDTERNPAFWARINQLDVAMLVIETAFSNREEELARRSLHLSPGVLASELDNIDTRRSFPIYITHTKPAETDLIMEEIRGFEQSQPSRAEAGHDIRWLRAGQEFEL